MSELRGVADTLFIPLAARIYVSKRFPEYFYDAAALLLERHLPDESIQKSSSEYSLMASAARYYNLDSMTKNFLAAHDMCNVVNLGSGLETAFFRLNSRNAVFYEIDLPEVIDSRRLALGEHPNEVLVGGDIFAMEWARQIDEALPTLLIASGVFHYYHEEEVIDFIHALQNAFPRGELIFDATNEKGIKYANRYVRKTGNASAPMYFFVNDGMKFARKVGVALLDRRAFFTDARKILGRKLGLYTRIAMKIVDNDGRAILLHLKLN